MYRIFKIIGRHPFNKRQIKKRVYTSQKDYMKYKDDLTKRYRSYLNVEHYELVNNEWEIIFQGNYDGGCTWINGYKY